MIRAAGQHPGRRRPPLGGDRDAGTRRHRIVVVGAGGNVGSHLVPHLGRMPSVGRVTLIDRDRYTCSNLPGQDLLPGDVGRAKAGVQARRLRRINPSLEVIPALAAVEDFPRGLLRADVILACLDSRRARQCVNEIAWQLGVPWIDSGVAVLAEGGLLARVCVYVPGEGHPCLECAWDDRHYETLEQDYPCGGPVEAPRTGAPSSLGALAAALLALECRMLLAGDPDRAGRQVVLDAASGSLVVTRFRRRAECRLPGHGIGSVAPLPASVLDMSLDAALALTDGDGASRATGRAPGLDRAARSAISAATLEVEGRVFERRRLCTGCGRARAGLRLHVPSRGSPPCRACGKPTVAAGFDLADCLRAEDLSGPARARSLRRLGVRPGDLLRIGGPGGDRIFEIGGDPA